MTVPACAADKAAVSSFAVETVTVERGQVDFEMDTGAVEGGLPVLSIVGVGVGVGIAAAVGVEGTRGPLWPTRTTDATTIPTVRSVAIPAMMSVMID